jgi:hypothetical protein
VHERNLGGGARVGAANERRRESEAWPGACTNTNTSQNKADRECMWRESVCGEGARSLLSQDTYTIRSFELTIHLKAAMRYSLAATASGGVSDVATATVGGTTNGSSTTISCSEDA